MKRSIAIAVLAGLMSVVTVPGTSFADAAAIATIAAKPKPRAATALTLKNAATTPGEKKTYEATLRTTTPDAPVANKKVMFRIEGKNGTSVPNGGIAIGEGVTDAEGRATVSFSTPELAQGAYALKASFAGDHEMLADGAEANLFVAKAVVKFEMSDATPFEAGSSILHFHAALIRDSDKKSMPKSVTLTVNGQSRKLSTGGSWQLVLQPMEASSWKVKLQWEGDDSTLPASAERTYTRPPKK